MAPAAAPARRPAPGRAARLALRTRFLPHLAHFLMEAQPLSTLLLIISLLLQLLPPTATSTAMTTIHVSAAEGSDTRGNGSERRPFRTLQRAKTAARAAAAAQRGGPAWNVTVSIGAGDYYVQQPLRFTSADAPQGGGGGDEPIGGARTTYSGPGPQAAEQANVFGGVLVPAALWRQAEGGGTTGNIWVADVSKLLPPGPDDDEGVKKAEPFFNLIEGEVGAVLARTPDKGSGYLRDAGCRGNTTLGRVVCPPGVLPGRLLSDDVGDLSMYCVLGSRNSQGASTHWSSNTFKVVAVSADAIEVGGALRGCSDKLYVQGSKQLITEPGEWALDSSAGLLYIWPRDEAAMAHGQARVVASTAMSIFDVAGESFTQLAGRITFEGLSLIGSERVSGLLHSPFRLGFPSVAPSLVTKVRPDTPPRQAGTRVSSSGRATAMASRLIIRIAEV